MSELLEMLLSNPTVVAAITAAVGAGISYLGKLVADLLRAKLSGTKYGNAITKITDTLTSAILCAEQTVMPKLIAAKADGKVTDEEKVGIRQSVWNTTTTILGGDAGITKLCKDLDMSRVQFELLLGQMLEALVAKLT